MRISSVQQGTNLVAIIFFLLMAAPSFALSPDPSGKATNSAICVAGTNEKAYRSDAFPQEFQADYWEEQNGVGYRAFDERIPWAQKCAAFKREVTSKYQPEAKWFQLIIIRDGDQIDRFAPYLEHVSWAPTGGNSLASARRTATVELPSPGGVGKGYFGLSFDVEYQYIGCFDELHLAYSVVEDSVRPYSKFWGYSLNGRSYKLKSPPTTILSVPLVAKVFIKPRLGFIRVADDHAAKAMAWGCFTGQSKPIGKFSDLNIGSGKQPTKEEFDRFLKRLDVNFETVQVLTSTAAEQEIDAGAAEASKTPHKVAKEDSAAADLEAKRQAAEERAARKAAEEAEFQAKHKAYEEGLAAHEAAVAEYEKALAETNAKNAAALAQAKAAQEEYARKQAEYEAEAARVKKAQEDYEAQYGKPQ